MDVKFYRLGFNKPVSDASYREIAFANNGENGNIVFAKVDSSIANVSDGKIQVIPPTYYICAGGIEYKVADADALTMIFDKFENLVSNASVDGEYTNVESVHYWIQEAIKDVQITAEAVYKVIDASNKTYDTSDDVRYQIARSAEGIDASIRKGEGDAPSSLLFGVDLDKIYLPTGVQRTEAIGVCDASDGIITDGIGMSVKELLEYWLVKEKFPVVHTEQGAQSFGQFWLNVTGYPNALVKSYITVDGNTAPNTNTLLEIGTPISVAAISGTLACTSTRNNLPDGDWANSKESTASKITGINFGYSVDYEGDPTGDGHLIPYDIVHDTEIVANTTVATATYHMPEEPLTGYVRLTIPTDVSITSELENNAYSIQLQDTSIQPGNNIFKLEVSHNAAATRDLDKTSIAGINKVYVVSNKGHIALNESATVAGSTIGNIHDAIVRNYTTSNVKYIGVYPIFTNGKVVATNANRSQFDWYNNEYSIDPSNKLDLVDYTAANQTYIIAFGATNATNQRECYMFVPKGMTFTVPKQAELDGNENIASWENNNSRSQSWIKLSTVEITVQGNEVEYDVYTENTPSGAWAYKVQIDKK